MIQNLLAKVVGTQNERDLKRLRPIVGQVGALEQATTALSDDQLRDKTAELRARIARGETPDDLLVEAFAVVREAGRRTLQMRHFDVQLIGGAVLHKGKIAEMKTGEARRWWPAGLPGRARRQGRPRRYGERLPRAATRNGWAGSTASSA